MVKLNTIWILLLLFFGAVAPVVGINMFDLNEARNAYRLAPVMYDPATQIMTFDFDCSPFLYKELGIADGIEVTTYGGPDGTNVNYRRPPTQNDGLYPGTFQISLDLTDQYNITGMMIKTKFLDCDPLNIAIPGPIPKDSVVKFSADKWENFYILQKYTSGSDPGYIYSFSRIVPHSQFCLIKDNLAGAGVNNYGILNLPTSFAAAIEKKNL